VELERDIRQERLLLNMGLDGCPEDADSLLILLSMHAVQLRECIIAAVEMA